MDPLTVDGAARAFALAWNTLEIAPLEPLLAEDVLFTSDLPLRVVDGRKDLVAYLAARFTAAREGRGPVGSAELGWTPYDPSVDDPEEPCVLLSFGQSAEPRAVVVFGVLNGRIAQIELSGISPDPMLVKRSGEFPR